MLTCALTVVAQAPNSTLLPSDPKEAALVEQWISLATSEIGTPTSLINQLCHSTLPYNKAVSPPGQYSVAWLLIGCTLKDACNAH